MGRGSRREKEGSAHPKISVTRKVGNSHEITENIPRALEEFSPHIPEESSDETTAHTGDYENERKMGTKCANVRQQQGKAIRYRGENEQKLTVGPIGKSQSTEMIGLYRQQQSHGRKC